MFLVEDTRYGVTNEVFTWEDPRQAGFKGSIETGVTLDYNMELVHAWLPGQNEPEACLGRASDDHKHYKVFRYCDELRAAGYEMMPGPALVFGSWRDYLQLHLIPPDPDQVESPDWFDYLDRVDEASRRKRNRSPAPAKPSNGSRDEVAAWVAEKHFLADSAIREIWYLPKDAPKEEIRLLELNDRLMSEESHAEALDFGLDVDGARFRLLVADITSDQLERIKRDSSQLPPGWALGGNQIWRRGA